MLPASFKTKTESTMPALLCVLAVFYVATATLPHYVGDYFSGILAVFTMYPFFIFGLIGYILYMAVLFTALYKIGNAAREGESGRYISSYILFVVLLDLLVYQFVPANGITAIGLILAQPFSLYSLIPLAFMLLGALGLIAKKPALKSLSAVFGATFILVNTLVFN